MFNVVILSGRLTATPELKTTTSGTPVCTFSIAVERPHKNGNEPQVDFITCIAWQHTANFVSKYFTKGKMIGVQGRLQTRKYEKNNETRIYYEIVVDNVHFLGSKDDNNGSADNLPEFANKLENAQKSNGIDLDIAVDDDGDLPFI